MMNSDAFSEGVEPGGLRSQSEIRLLVCHLLRKMDVPMTSEAIFSAVTQDGLANYFETADALDELSKSGSVESVEESGEIRYKLSEQGKMLADTLAQDLPVSVRLRAVQSAVELQAHSRREAENEVTFTRLDAGYLVKCRIPDGGGDLMTVELRVPDRTQAERVRRRFLHDPVSFYLVVSALLTGDSIQLNGLNDNIAHLIAEP